jgi:hypothetical protein
MVIYILEFVGNIIGWGFKRFLIISRWNLVDFIVVIFCILSFVNDYLFNLASVIIIFRLLKVI